MNKELWEMYGDLIFNKFSFGGFIKKKDKDKGSTQIAYNRIYTNEEVHYYIQITKLPRYIYNNLIDVLRHNLDVNYRGKINVDFLIYANTYKINWSSNEIKSNQDVWKVLKKSSDKIKEGDTSFSSNFTQYTVDASDYRKESWDYFKKSELDNSLALISLIIRIRIPQEEETYTKVLLDILNDTFYKCDIQCYQIKNYIFDVLKKFSPFYSGSTDFAEKLINKKSVDSKIISSLTSVAQGELNKGNLILGNDIFNMKEVYLNTKFQVAGNTNVVISAQAGSGKSMLIKLLDEQIHAEGDFLYIIDYKGFEYDELGYYYNAEFLDLGSEDGKYYEPLILTEDNKNSISSLLNAVTSMVSVLMGHTLTASQVLILSDAVKDLFRYNNIIIGDPTTYNKSKNLRMKDLLKRIKNYSTSVTKLSKYNDDLKELLNTMEVYFEGIYSYMFKTPISLTELRDKKILIVRMRNSVSDAVTGDKDIDIKIKQLSAILIINELARYRRSRNEFFYVQIEELQSYIEVIGVDVWINAMWSEFRQYNGTCIGILNNPEKIKTSVESVINNTENFIIGKTPDIEGLSRIFKNIKMQGVENLMIELFNNPYTFIYKDSTTTSIFKSEIPEFYAREKRFITRTLE